ncbi:kinesin-like protein KIF13A [Ptychodera flava]|uniref:kinesin-like protein KIF13A n=1 Tax=Ptychodera flava TaxID=63121 RepID=UPI00396A1753
MQTRYQQWEEERDDVFRQSLSKLREEVVKANAMVREANFLAEEMEKQTEFHVTLQIPASNLTPNRKDTGVPISGDPFYETQENHNLIGVANIFLEVLFHDVKLSYAVPIINQQGEVSGQLHIELQRISGPLLDRSPDSDTSTDSGGYEVLGDVEPEGLSLGSQLTCRFRISQASGLPPSLANFVFCQYTFWGEEDSSVVPPIFKQVTTRRKIPEYSMKFDHVKVTVVSAQEGIMPTWYHLTSLSCSLDRKIPKSRSRVQVTVVCVLKVITTSKCNCVSGHSLIVQSATSVPRKKGCHLEGQTMTVPACYCQGDGNELPTANCSKSYGHLE